VRAWHISHLLMRAAWRACRVHVECRRQRARPVDSGVAMDHELAPGLAADSTVDGEGVVNVAHDVVAEGVVGSDVDKFDA